MYATRDRSVFRGQVANMKFNARSTLTVVALVGVMMSLPLSSASAITATQATKIKLANAVYAKVIAKAKTDFKVAIKPSYDAVLAVGKPAERARRAKVKTALAAFNLVVVKEKAPSIAAEKAYKVLILKLVADRTNTQLKLQAKAALLTLTSATAALKVDAKIKAARVVFGKQRAIAMVAFRTTILKALIVRREVLVREIVKFKAKKIRAQAALKAAIKVAMAGN